jgi:hypothetical protein
VILIQILQAVRSLDLARQKITLCGNFLFMVCSTCSELFFIYMCGTVLKQAYTISTRTNLKSNDRQAWSWGGATGAVTQCPRNSGAHPRHAHTVHVCHELNLVTINQQNSPTGDYLHDTSTWPISDQSVLLVRGLVAACLY